VERLGRIREMAPGRLKYGDIEDATIKLRDMIDKQDG
jgi:hypothetical protein